MAGASSRVSRVLMTGPVAPFADEYVRELRRRGYTALTSVNQLRQVSRLSGWLARSGWGVADLTEERVEEFLVVQRMAGRHRSQWSRPGLWCLLDVLRGLGVTDADPTPQTAAPVDVLLGSFARYLLVERGLAVGTVRGYVDHARRFLAGVNAESLSGVTAGDVIRAVLETSDAVAVSTAQNFVAAVRALLHFSFVQGQVPVDLSQAALAVTGRRRSTLPLGITPADARAILDSCDRRSVIGRRDYAIIVLLLRLGLRRGEVAGLTLDDIDWRSGALVVRGKGSRSDQLPLPADVGQAIAAYLRRARPASDRREVFLTGRPPVRPIASGTVASTVRRACRRAGVPVVGSHRLRHTAACEMVSTGVSLVQVAQVLRHHSLQTTAGYADMAIKQAAMDRTRPPNVKPGTYQPEPDILAWLTSL
jgi:integrase/recombinase XerD